MKSKIPIILMAEDDPDDRLLVKDAFEETQIPNNLLFVEDGEELMSFLLKEDAESSQTPDLILLDLNMPRKDGREALREIKASPTLRRIPIVILTTSKDEEDVLRSYDLHANCYITKPIDLAQFLMVVRSIEEFWLTIVRLPPERVR